MKAFLIFVYIEKLILLISLHTCLYFIQFHNRKICFANNDNIIDKIYKFSASFTRNSKNSRVEYLRQIMSVKVIRHPY